MHISWARLASLCDPLIVSKFHNETNDPKGQENKINTIVKGRTTFYRRHTVPVTSCSEVKYVLKNMFGKLLFIKLIKLAYLKKAQVKTYDIYFFSFHCYGRQVADKICPKYRNCHILQNLRLFGTDFLSIRYQHMRIPPPPKKKK